MIRSQVEEFGRYMSDVLVEPQNLAKTHWGECDEKYLLTKIKEHLNAISDPNISPLRKMRKFIHIANFCMMGFDKTIQLLPEEHLDDAKGD